MRRQELPESAFQKLPFTPKVLVLSYPWLAEEHPDGDLFLFSQLGSSLKYCDVAVFMD